MLNLTWYEDSAKGYPINYNPNIRLNDMELIGQSYKSCTGIYPLIRGDKGICWLILFANC